MKHDADDGVTISETSSVCPSCLAIIPARVFERDGKVWMGKSCRKHGRFEELYWGDAAMFRRAMRWAHDGKGIANPKVAKGDPVCPQDCGLCSMHKSHTALANIALTTRCDRNCFYCFFYAGKLGYVYEPSMGQIREMLSNLRNEKPVPCNAVQLTGGEPTLREDLVDIIRMCKEEGFDHVQLNTNGIRLGRDPALALKVRQAGVNTLYLSFDGITPKTNPKNHWEIPATLDSCRKADMGVVLVPTVIKGTNDHEAADILRFGFRNIDVVRSVNFQPVSLVGMMPREERLSHRITIPDVIKSIEEGTGGQVAREDFYPVPTVASITSLVEALTGKAEYDLSAHFACGMATYVFQDGRGGMLPVTRFVDVEGFFEYLGSQAEALKSGRNRYVAMLGMLRKIGSFIDKEKAPKGFNVGSILFNALVKHDYEALGKFHERALFVGMMHFQDLYNYDIERVKRCCIHYAMTDGRIIPFCAFNVIPQWYRDKAQKSQGIPIGKWEHQAGRKITDDLYRRNEKELERSQLYRKTYGARRAEVKGSRLRARRASRS